MCSCATGNETAKSSRIDSNFARLNLRFIRVEHAEQKPTRLPVVAVIGRYSTRLREGFCGTRQRRQ
jgi:hypothetical protein